MKETFAHQDASRAAPFQPGKVNGNTMNLDPCRDLRCLDHCAAKSFLAIAYWRFARWFHRSSEHEPSLWRSDLL